MTVSLRPAWAIPSSRLKSKQTKSNKRTKKQYRVKAHRDPRILCYIKDLGKATICNPWREALGRRDLASIFGD